MDDATLLAEELGHQKEKYKRLKDDHTEQINTIRALRRRLMGKDIFWLFTAIVVGLGIIGGLGWLSLKGLNSYETKHCYIERDREMVDVYEVYRTVEWGVDRELGYSTDLNRAMEIARKQGCRAPKVGQ